MQTLLNMEGFVADAICADGMNALSLAVGYRNKEMVELLLQTRTIRQPPTVLENLNPIREFERGMIAPTQEKRKWCVNILFCYE